MCLCVSKKRQTGIADPSVYLPIKRLIFNFLQKNILTL